MICASFPSHLTYDTVMLQKIIQCGLLHNVPRLLKATYCKPKAQCKVDLCNPFILTAFQETKSLYISLFRLVS